MINRLYGQNDSREITGNIKDFNKRAFDLILGVMLLVASLPVIIIISAVLIFKFRGTPFYFQKRGLSLNKRIFTIVKFRTMAAANPIEKINTNFLLKNIPSQEIDRFCSWLRKTGLDELPQIFNVLRGNMSFVGPRPLSVWDLNIMQREAKELYSRREELRVKPGITGLWQLFGNRSEGVVNLITLDVKYELNKSFILDAFIILKTIPVILFAHHSDAILDAKEFNRTVNGKKKFDFEKLLNIGWSDL